jgi:hypothetical protein
MKVIVITSDHSEVPLAELRTDGTLLDFVVDNTNGQLPKMFQNNYQRMVDVVRKSSHMKISQPDHATVNLLRYVMDNGDSVEITSDGHTVVLNGKLLDQDEKDALFNAVKRGELKVARKTDIQQAIPVLPSSQPSEQMKPINTKLSSSIMQSIQSDQDKREEAQRMSDSSHDEEIENADLHGAEDKEWVKQMMYWLKYDNGDSRR